MVFKALVCNITGDKNVLMNDWYVCLHKSTRV